MSDINLRAVLHTSVKNVLIALTFIMTMFVIVPLFPVFPSYDLDPSWAFGMNVAIAKEFRLGLDIVFTYGPYAFLSTKQYHPDLYYLMFYTSLFVAAIYGMIFTLVLRNSALCMLFYIMLAPLLSRFSMDSIYLLLPLASTLYLARYSPPLNIALYVCTLALGLVSLIKGSYFIFNTFFIIVIALYFILQKKQITSFLLFVLYFASLVSFWLISGQDIASLPHYIKGVLMVTQGYSQSMSTYYTPWVPIFYILSSIIIIFCLAKWRAATTLNHVFVVFILVVTTYFLFKAGFVRQVDHIRIAISALILISIITASYYNRKRRIIQLSIITGLSLLIFNSHFGLNLNILKRYHFKTIQSPREAISNFKSSNEYFRVIYERNVSNIRSRNPLSVVPGTSDLYNHDLSFLLSTENDWRPRPIFQSYSAYTKKLLDINRDHLLSSPPDNIFIKVETVDNRLPSLDDGASWPIMLNSYYPDSMYGNYLHLIRQPEVTIPENMVFYQSIHRLNELVKLPKIDGFIFSKISVKKTLIGQLLNLFYKPDALYIQVVYEDNTVNTYRFIASIGESPFLLSPIVRNTNNFKSLYEDPGSLKNVTFIKLFSGGIGTDWQDEYEIELIKYDFSL